jgi:hypothetical protein
VIELLGDLEIALSLRNAVTIRKNRLLLDTYMRIFLTTKLRLSIIHLPIN